MEIAFVGKSNSGKSSVINTLTCQKKLAQVSRNPGSTRFINLFMVNPKIYLIDFPGYGFSKFIKMKKNFWHNILCQYIKNRKNLKGLVLIIDIRHLIMELDQKIISYAIKYNIPILILLNKSDKISKNKCKIIKKKIQCQIRNCFTNNSHVYIEIFSSIQKIGVVNLRKILDFWLKKFSSFN